MEAALLPGGKYSCTGGVGSSLQLLHNLLQLTVGARCIDDGWQTFTLLFHLLQLVLCVGFLQGERIEGKRQGRLVWYV